jgi:hypothetical protein
MYYYIYISKKYLTGQNEKYFNVIVNDRSGLKYHPSDTNQLNVC